MKQRGNKEGEMELLLQAVDFQSLEVIHFTYTVDIKSRSIPVQNKNVYENVLPR